MSSCQLHTDDDRIRLAFAGRTLFEHSREQPLITLGCGVPSIHMYRGNFQIDDRIDRRVALTQCHAEQHKDAILLRCSSANGWVAILRVEEQDRRLVVHFDDWPADANRLWLRIAAEPEEKVYGLGAQFSHFNLRGRNFPLWTSEPGVGRNKATAITQQADREGRAGGDYYHTGFPAPTFVSSLGYWAHLDCSAYMDFDFRAPDGHVVHAWAKPQRLTVGCGDSPVALVEDLSDFVGRGPQLPRWPHRGIILGCQGGTEAVAARLERAQQAGVAVSGLWCQDWAGIRNTSFGQRLRWNWRWDRDRYPRLDSHIAQWHRNGVRFLAYLNPHLSVDGELFPEAAAAGAMIADATGKPSRIDFGEFDAGTFDLTNPAAGDWFKEHIGKPLIELGCEGWMADFGEYLPTDCRLNSGLDPLLAHNLWPTLWAELNHTLVRDHQALDRVLFFMRSGFSGAQRHAVSFWSGDQCVDWSHDDGLPSVIPAALSVGLCGAGVVHSDIGGYTTLFGLRRSKELFLRWLEMAAFSPLMRTHEGNRPADNHQFDSDSETLAAVARFSRLHAGLAPYLEALVDHYQQAGLPLMRPLWLHYPDDRRTYDCAGQYMLGSDLLVAPVLKPDVNQWPVYLPPDRWLHLWTGAKHHGGEVTVSAPVGSPPVFVRADGPWGDRLRQLLPSPR